MPLVLAFDVYGTLIDTYGVVIKLRGFIGDMAEEFSRVWRDKQLEYCFRRRLMRTYEGFGVCVSQALDHTNEFLDAGLTADQKMALLEEYRGLPAFNDVQEPLGELKSDGHSLYAFSNGTADAVETLLSVAGIRDLFNRVISVDDCRTCKNGPDVYRYFLNTTGASADETWLVSSNPFDVIGAVSSGLQGVWVRRFAESTFDPWGIEPTATICSLHSLRDQVSRAPRGV